MKKLLYIGPDISNALTGGNQGNQHRVQLFQAILGKENVDCFFVGHPLQKYRILFNNLMLYSTDFNFLAERKILKKLKGGTYQYCFLSRSLLGRLAPKIKSINPSIKIITWFQNVEIYFTEETSYQNIIYRRLMKAVSKYNEKKAVDFSDIIIALNQRDNDLIFKNYNRQATIILPVAFKDIFNLSQTEKISENNTYLFVGSDFRPNIDGISWFVDKVMPFVKGQLQIVGFGLEKYKSKLARVNVEVIGTVEDISPYYYNSSLVIAPIFKGGGMKTKIAEALMFGKTVLGTTEAMQGYNISDKIGYVCNTAEEFIFHINNREQLPRNFNPESRELFEKEHSMKSLEKKVRTILNY